MSEIQTEVKNELKNEDFDIVTTFTITRGQWMTADQMHSTGPEWMGFYYEEFATDWSMFPGCWGKLVMETMDCDIPASEGKPAIKEGGWLRLAYQYHAHTMIPVEGSEAHSKGIISARWQMVHSNWFKLPETPGDACVWIEGKSEPGKQISLALATLHVARPKNPIPQIPSEG